MLYFVRPIYDGYVGPGTKNSSPGLINAASKKPIASDTPLVIKISSGDRLILLKFFSRFAIASLSCKTP